MNTTREGQFLVYGSYGYSGDHIVRRAIEQGRRPILAGRNERALIDQADRYGLEYRVFDLDDTAAARAALADVDLVMHCAGPFTKTSQVMVDHCLATGTHYLDITGEVPVLEALSERDAEARDAGVMLMGAVGFDVVPTDCLAAHLHDRMPTATSLTLGFEIVDNGAPTRGTQRTLVEGILDGGAVRSAGTIHKIPTASRVRRIDFGDGRRKLAAAIPWGDVSTAFHSTGIPNIEVYMAVSRPLLFGLRIGRLLTPLLRTRAVQRVLDAVISRQSAGPDDETNATSRSLLWGEARDADGNTVVTRISAPGTYTITPLIAVEIIERALSGAAVPGFRTPSQVFGADFILEFDDVVRTDNELTKVGA